MVQDEDRESTGTVWVDGWAVMLSGRVGEGVGEGRAFDLAHRAAIEAVSPKLLRSSVSSAVKLRNRLAMRSAGIESQRLVFPFALFASLTHGLDRLDLAADSPSLHPFRRHASRLTGQRCAACACRAGREDGGKCARGKC